MFTKLMLGAAMAAALASAQTDEQKAKYKKWTTQAGIWEYDWEPVEVVTDDGYTITLMHVTKKSGILNKGGKVDKNMAPLLVVPPMGSTPDTWLSAYLYNSPPTNPMLL